jgi:chromosome segregation ATPase
VTLDGDKVNPSGELSGGAVSKSGSMLTQVQAVIEASNSLEGQQEKLHEAEKQLRELEIVAKKFNNLKHQHEIKNHELELIRERLQTTRHHQLAEEVKEMEAENDRLATEVKEANTLQNQGSNKMKELEYKIVHAKELKVIFFLINSYHFSINFDKFR